MVQGLYKATTDIIVFADDDVLWPPQFLKYLITAFENPNVGAAGPIQRLQRCHPTLCHFLGTSYLERRNFNTGACNTIDGSVSILFGRTSVFRRQVLGGNFVKSFLGDKWDEKVLNSDDDKFLTSWVFRQRWEIKLQFAGECVLETGLEGSVEGFLAQCKR